MAQSTKVSEIRDRGKVLLTRYPRMYDAARKPYAVGRFWLGRVHDPEYGVFGLMPEEAGPFLDIGANAGMSALSFRTFNRRSPIISIEPNPFHEPDLRFVSRLVKPFTYRMWGAGAEDAEMTLHVPVYRDVPLTTEASLYPEQVYGSSSLRARLGDGMDSEGFKVVPCTVPVKALDGLGIDPAFAKLDVQGAEHAALVGLRATLERAKPLLLVETPDAETRTFLDDLGYATYSYIAERDELVPEQRGRLNTVFIHRDMPVPARRA